MTGRTGMPFQPTQDSTADIINILSKQIPFREFGTGYFFYKQLKQNINYLLPHTVTYDMTLLCYQVHHSHTELTQHHVCQQ